MAYARTEPMTTSTQCACGATLADDDARCPSCGAPRDAVAAEGPRITGAAVPVLGRTRRKDDPLQHTSLLEPVRVQGPQTLVPGDLHADDIARMVEGGEEPTERNVNTSSIFVAPAVRRRRSRWLRAVPLAGVLGVFVAAVAFGAHVFAPRTAPPLPPTAVPATLGETVTLAAGSFTLGLTEDNKEVVLALCYRTSDNPSSECRRQYLTDLGEYPARSVEFGPLRIDRYEVSNASWANCRDAGACPERDIDACAFHSVARGRELREPVPQTMLAPDRPAICVTAAEADAFCRWRHMRLPTADEWERAARSGDDRLQPWGPFIMPGLMNWGERILGAFPIPGRVDGHELTAPVDEYRSGATDDGVHNLLGNVAEWVHTPATDGAEPAVGTRGGSYVDDAPDLRATRHTTLTGDERRSTIGFRCVR